ncbi:MAG TPA: glycosyltransferase family 39 protein [Blastocatellia bacterium]|nr:glycosyltransferase family 39 protein [Blastocatellia bacterium]
MTFLKKYFDFAILAIVLGGFVVVAAERLATVPLPDTDESMMLQISYEMLNHGKLAFPMKRFYGGNIENAWHSLTPVAFVTLSGFLKAFGWGLVQGRAFNLLTAVFVLLMTYLVARKIFSWQVGIVAIVLMISDPVFLARSRLVRYDMLAAAFGLLAFYLYEKAEERQSSWVLFASGLAAGAGVMSHTTLLYMILVVGVLMLLRHGWKILKTSKPYVFAAGALAAMSYEIVFAVVDYKNFILQTRKDDVHFGVLEHSGWLRNLVSEPIRYVEWFEGHGARIAPHMALLHLFLVATVVAIVYLIARSSIEIRRGRAASDTRLRLLVTTAVVALFLAVAVQRKVIQYVIHLSPWFALCVAVLLNDAVIAAAKLKYARWKRARLAYSAATVILVVLGLAYGYELLMQNKNYLAEVRNPEQPDFEEMKAAIRDVVPAGLCPVSIGSGYWWLAFPEYDYCYFAFMEARLDEPLDLDGKEYALIAKPKFEDRLRKLTGAGFEQYHLLGELNTTALGTFYVYYTGRDPAFLTLPAKRFYFFGRQRGSVSDRQIVSAREVWSASEADLTPENATLSVREIESDEGEEQGRALARAKLLRLVSVELEPDTIYQLVASTSCPECELLIRDDNTGAMIQRMQPDRIRSDRFEGLFKTGSFRRVNVTLRISGAQAAAGARVSNISIREIAQSKSY